MKESESRKEKIKKKVSDISTNNNLGRHEVIANIVRNWLNQGTVNSGDTRQPNYLRRR